MHSANGPHTWGLMWKAWYTHRASLRWKMGSAWLSVWLQIMPDGLTVAADVLAVGALQQLNAMGIAVPDELAVVSVNGQSIARYTSPPLSSYVIDQYEMARMALSTLIDGLKHERHMRRHLLLTTELAVRDSFVPRS